MHEHFFATREYFFTQKTFYMKIFEKQNMEKNPER